MKGQFPFVSMIHCSHKIDMLWTFAVEEVQGRDMNKQKVFC